MFYSIRGKLIHTEPGVSVIECGGVGFKCFTSLFTQKALPKIGDEAMLYTSLNVREDALDLFGFATLSEQNCFRLLTSITGVGSKVGLALLSALSPEQLALAVASGDSKTLTRAPGVGPKLAQRIVLELKDKVAAIGAPTQAEGIGEISASLNASEAVKALTVLGYTPSEAALAVGKLDSTQSVEELIRGALRALGRK